MKGKFIITIDDGGIKSDGYLEGSLTEQLYFVREALPAEFTRILAGLSRGNREELRKRANEVATKEIDEVGVKKKEEKPEEFPKSKICISDEIIEIMSEENL